MPRCLSSSSSDSGSSARASGWCGATAYTKRTCPSGLARRLAALEGSRITPMARSALPEVSAPTVPLRISSRRRSRVGGLRLKKSQHSSIRAECEIRPSAAMVSSGSQPVATRLTRFTTASTSCFRRSPCASSSAPAAVGRAWRELRSNSSTSSASSIWRTR